MHTKRAFALALAVWAGLLAAGFGALWNYANTPGAPGDLGADWRWTDRLPFDDTRANLVLFAHPRCPCTQASLENLARIQRACRGRFTTHLVFYEPPDATPDWRDTALWRRARDLPDTNTLSDPAGALSLLAGAHTSGTVALFSIDRRLLFWGGITAARAHAGDNLGSDAVTDLLHQRDARSSTPVYGCAIASPADPSSPQTCCPGADADE